MQTSFLVSSTPLVVSPADPAGRRALWVRKGARPRGCVVASASGGESKVMKMLSKECFAKISRNTETSSVGTPPLPVSPPPSSFGSPLFWIGVGVGISALFSWAANRAKNYAIQQAFKTMGSMAQEKGPFATSGMFPGTTFPSNPQASSFRMPPPPPPPPPAVSKSTAAVDATDAKVEPPPTTNTEDVLSNEEPKKYSFVDISPEDVSQTGSSEGFRYTNEVVQPNGSSVKQDKSEAYEQSQSQKSPVMSVEALEKMMEDPTVQKMVYPYLPEEMRNPTTFKWMMQNPQYRAQLQEMLNNMGGSTEWDNQVMNSLKNFDLSSPEVKQQFDQIGLSPEEVISKIMENPDVAMSFQNPKVQAAIMDCSQNPLNIRKYQDDKEVMDVFDKISQLFPGVSDSF